MGREVKRVALDFDWPLGKVWEGFLSPDRFAETPCDACCYDKPPTIMDALFGTPARHGSGYSPHAENLHNLWYGYAPFDPATTGSVPFRADTPAVRQYAERNVGQAPDFYGSGEFAIVREAQRLADLWNAQWGHHLSQDDVDALVAADRLMDFTHDWTREGGWQPKDPPVSPTAAQVNEWSLAGFGHDSINCMIAIRARCEREGVTDTCPACGGHGSLEAYEGQRAEAEAWERTEPPAGEGWQLWETVTEGSPKSPVFATAEELVTWMSDPDRGRDWLTPEAAAKFVQEGWAPTFVSTPQTGFVSGAEFVGRQED